MKKIPQRTCLGCGETKPKQELIRIVRQNDGSIFVDKTGKVIVDYAYDDAMEQNDYGFVAVKKECP